MEQIKKNWKIILIIVLAVFSLSKCTQSCNRACMANKLETEINNKDSVIKTLKDSCTVLNTTIKVYEERVSGMQQSIDIQNEANKRISEANKNISVNLKTK